MPDIFDEFLDELKRRQSGQPDGGDADEGAEPGSAEARDERRQTPPRSAPGDPRPDDGEPPRFDRPRPRVIRPDRPRRPRGTWIPILLAFAILLFLSIGVGFWTDVLWYRSVGFESVLWTKVGAVGGLFVLGTATALVALIGNLLIARRLAPPSADAGGAGGGLGDLLDRMTRASAARRGWEPGPRPVVIDRDALPDLTPAGTVVIVGISILVALTIGGGIAADWQTVLLWLHRVPFAPDGAAAVSDPVFGKDISWFLFELPFYRAIQSAFNSLVLASLVVAAARYLIGLTSSGLRIPTPVRVHLAVLGGLFLLSVAFGYQLDKYELVYSDRMPAGTVGVSYTDAHAQFLAYDLLTALSAFTAAFLVGAAFTRWIRPLGFTIGAWFLASFLLGSIYPELVQRFTVVPNPLVQESPYIANNLAMTRLAYNLGGWSERSYSGDAPLTATQISEDAATFQNARLWDYRPLGNTIDQLQTVRRYYKFVDVDTDRYDIDGQLRQVMLSGRELDLAANDQATGWLNQRIIYTHGIGTVMVPVNEVTPEGQPVLFIKNLPPVSSDGAPAIDQPRIYFGEKDNGYVIVGAQQAEFDYPQASQNGGDVSVPTRWTGTTGITLSSTLDRLLFALRYGDLDLLISNQITNDSQILVHRTLAERLQLLAPFLQYDNDPYLVVDGNGRLVYVQDAYTTTDRFPNAQPFDPSTLPSAGITGRLDYIRNSVKITMDAYDGTMHFYVADPTDPLIRDWSAIFPGLFQPIADLPSALAPHLRYPEDLFDVQTQVFGKYHVTDPETFFNANDQWTVPNGKVNDQSLPSEAYYVVMRMPGESKAEFLLLQPMVPSNRVNMIAWVAARNDVPNYGNVSVFRFPSDTTVLGPTQIEARIDQDPTISAQITLWNQSGSSVIRGNLIVVPVGDSLVYLQPVYLQSTTSKFPEFQRIVVASPSVVVWGRTLSEALNLLLASGGQQPPPSPSPGGSPGPSATPGPSVTPAPTGAPGLPTDVAGLIAYANEHFAAAQAALRDGDFARYGQEIALVKQALAQLQQLAGPSPSP